MAEEKITASEQINKTVNNIDPEDRRAIYAAIIQLVCNAEQVSWNRFYNLLTGNAILILAWSALCNSPSTSIKIALTSICIFGLLLGILWSVQGHRGRRFLNHYAHFGMRMETEPQYMPKPLYFTLQLRDSRDKLKDGNDAIYEKAKSFKQRIYNFCGSRNILVIVPLLFSVLFSIMLIITWKDKVIGVCNYVISLF